MGKQSTSFCAKFWDHLCIRHHSYLKPCCRFIIDSYDRVYWSDDEDKTINSDFYRSLRLKALNNENIPGCIKCGQEESANITSLRMRDNASSKLKEPLDETTSFLNIESIDFFCGNLCNLKCVTCEPYSSSSWRSDYELLGLKVPPLSKKTKIESLLNQVKNLKKIKFVGGEPFLDMDHKNDLILLSKHNPAQIIILYSTNVTIWPSVEILNLWKSFKLINIHLSIDGHLQSNDYIRFPSKWDLIESNVNKFIQHSLNNKNIKLKIQSTVSVYNIWSIHKLQNWINAINIKMPTDRSIVLMFNFLHTPHFMSVKNLPNDYKIKAKALINSTLGKDSYVLNYLENCKDSDYPPNELIEFTQKLDKIRNINISDYIPELAKLIYPK